MNASSPVLLTVFTFTLVPLILAEMARKKSFPTAEDFFLQSRKMSTVLTFFTVYSTWMSIFAFLGAATYFYEKGPVYLTAIAWDALFGIGFYLIGRRIWFYGKKYKYITPTDFFNDIYGSKVLNIVITSVLVIFTFPYLQIQLSGGAYLIEVATQGAIPWRICGLLFYAIIIIYLWAGGLRAVALSDVFYGICLFVSMIFIGFYLIDMAGGITHVFEEIQQQDPLNIVLPGPKGDAGPLFWICLFIAVPVGALMGPQMWIRSYAVEKKETFNIMPFLLALVAIQCLGPMLAGSAGILLAPGMDSPDKLIPSLLLSQGQMFLCGLLFCGIAAAALSTANSQIHALAAIYTIDIHRKYINPKASDLKLLQIAKLAVVIISVIAYTFLLKNPTIIMETGVMALGGISQIIVPTLGALFWKKSNASAALFGMICGIFSLVIFSLFWDLDSCYNCIMALLVNSIVFVFFGFVFKENQQTKEKILRYKEDFSNEIYKLK